MNKNFFNKILLRFVIIILAASISLILSGQSDHIKQKQIELVNKIYQLQRHESKNFNIEIHYPQVQTQSFQGDLSRINSMLKDAAVAALDSSYEVFVANVEKEIMDYNNWVEYEVTYEILQNNAQYISVIFSVFAYNGGAHPYTGSHMVTIDVSAAEYVYIQNLLCEEEFEDALLTHNFTTYEGTYSELSEEDVHTPELINELIEIYKKQTKNGTECQNLGMDQTFYYVYIISNKGFHNYFILKIPRKSIDNITQDLVLTDEVYLLKRDESQQKDINVKVQYPAVVDGLEHDTAKQTNSILKNAVFSLIAPDTLEELKRDYNQGIDIEITYQVLQADTECIRVIFMTNKSENLVFHLDLKKEHVVTVEKVKNIDSLPPIIQIITGNDYVLALCEDGTVWSWGENEEGKLGITASSSVMPQKILELENIVKIIDAGDVLFALDQTGNVFTWGKNLKYLFRETDAKDRITQVPVRVEALKNIVDMDAGNNRLFALNQDGNLYSLGLYLYRGDESNEIQLLMPYQSGLAGAGLESIIAGAEYYHYFIRKDGTVFSVMEYLDNGLGEPFAFIFPTIKNQKDAVNIEYNALEDLENIRVLSESTKEGATIYYSIDGMKEIQAVSSDGYTVFVSKKDGTLLYWNSDRIKYHDNAFALINPESGTESTDGNFEEIHFQDARKPHIVAMQSGKEHTIFLAEDGQVYYSRYETAAVENVNYYKRSNPDPSRLPSVSTIEDLAAKTITFYKLELEDIIQINSDNEDNFSAIDSKGNCYHIQFAELFS